MSASILETLRAEHDLIRALQDLLLETSGNTGYRAQLWLRLKTELLTHAGAEERAVYDLLAGRDESADMAAHSVKEHRALEEIIQQLDYIGFDQSEWLVTLRRLAHESSHHLAEEERELFPVAGRSLTEGEKAQCTDHYRSVKLQLMVRDAGARRRTTTEGRDQRTLDALDVDTLRDKAVQRGESPHRSRSELVSALRNTPATDA